jgi:hypothetical protein|tara:strand:+ start:196 stop:705 length:510 start_codon:yes stop_codon:yes gene_type:complete
MQKKVLSEISLYNGTVKMPKDWEIDREKLTKDILAQHLFQEDFKFSKNWDMLNTYIKDHINLKYNLRLVNKKTWGNIYKPNNSSSPLKEIDEVDLKNSPDFVLLYGVKIQKDSCFVKVFYDDNRRKGRSWDIPLNDNTFIMFPSTLMYYLSPNISKEMNFIQTITYEFI